MYLWLGRCQERRRGSCQQDNAQQRREIHSGGHRASSGYGHQWLLSAAAPARAPGPTAPRPRRPRARARVRVGRWAGAAPVSAYPY